MDRLDTLFFGFCAKFFFLSDLEISRPPELKRREYHRRKGQLFQTNMPGWEEKRGGFEVGTRITSTRLKYSVFR